jgi:hypothetical protein
LFTFWVLICHTNIFYNTKVYYTTAILLTGTVWINPMFSILDILLFVLTFVCISSSNTVVPQLHKLLKEFTAAVVRLKFHLWWSMLLQT